MSPREQLIAELGWDEYHKCSQMLSIGGSWWHWRRVPLNVPEDSDDPFFEEEGYGYVDQPVYP